MILVVFIPCIWSLLRLELPTPMEDSSVDILSCMPLVGFPLLLVTIVCILTNHMMLLCQ